jgi:replication factor C small subunit
MIKDMLFTEKYRPKTFDDVVGLDPKFKEIKEIPNLLLAGKCGIGKTTLAKIVTKDSDVLYLNASDERGIDVIRDKVKGFVSSASIENKRKIVHFDEADGLTFDAQNSLRNLIEEYASNARFIFTCNNIAKIIEPLRSRCMEINLASPPKADIAKYLANIIKSEQMVVDPSDLSSIITAHYPDIRSMVNDLQHLKMFGNVANSSSHNLATEIFDLVKKNKFTDARKLWISKSPDYKKLLVDMVDIMTDQEVEKHILTVAKYSYEMSFGAVQEISFAAAMKVISNA